MTAFSSGPEPLNLYSHYCHRVILSTKLTCHSLWTPNTITLCVSASSFCRLFPITWSPVCKQPKVSPPHFPLSLLLPLSAQTVPKSCLPCPHVLPARSLLSPLCRSCRHFCHETAAATARAGGSASVHIFPQTTSPVPEPLLLVLWLLLAACFCSGSPPRSPRPPLKHRALRPPPSPPPAHAHTHMNTLHGQSHLFP